MSKSEFLKLVQNYAAMCRVYGTGTEVCLSWRAVVKALDVMVETDED